MINPKLIEDFVTEHFDEGMIAPESHRRIADCIQKSIKEDGDWIVEIGSYWGNTTAFMARVLQALPTKHHKVISIDCFSNADDLFYNGIGIYGRMIDTLEKFHVRDMVIFIAGYSQEVYRFLQPGFCFLAIDGSHRYEDVKADLLNYFPLLRPGGMIWMDDLNPPYEGPAEAMLKGLAILPGLQLIERTKIDAVLIKA